MTPTNVKETLHPSTGIFIRVIAVSVPQATCEEYENSPYPNLSGKHYLRLYRSFCRLPKDGEHQEPQV